MKFPRIFIYQILCLKGMYTVVTKFDLPATAVDSGELVETAPPLAQSTKICVIVFAFVYLYLYLYFGPVEISYVRYR